MSRRKTTTSRFGSTGRISHHSRPFSRPRPETDAATPPEAVDLILPPTSEDMAELPAGCVHLMVTSPPYNAGKEYDQDLTLDEYRALLRRGFAATHPGLAGGGR